MVTIAELIRELPEDYEDVCYECGAIVRKRNIASPGDLMLLSMFHLLNGCSLLEVSEVARLSGIAELSDVAFMKRFEGCAAWFERINAEMADGATCGYRPPAWLKGRSVIALDASDVTEKGRSGRTYRLHYAMDVFKMKGVQYRITGQAVGEALSNFTATPGDLFIADRAYGTAKGIAHCLAGGADFVLRMRKGCFKLYDADGGVIDLLERLRLLADGEEADIPAFVALAGEGRVSVRVCASRKDARGIKGSRERLRRRDARKQKSTSEGAKEMNDYVVVVTSLGSEAPAKEVLDLYRLRWQVEICFKRLKSLLDYGELPKRREGSVMAWLNGKLMIALLIEKMLSKADFSPAGQIGVREESMA
jgi:hypothetical protein